MTTGKPQLLIFTLGPAREGRRRRLLPAAWGRTEEALHRSCLQAAMSAGRAAGCDLLVVAPEALALPADVRLLRQRGDGFGPRLANAVAAVEGEGRPLLLVGSDVPGLAPRHLQAALDRLAAAPDRVVLGPSPDGGIYLLAASRPVAQALAGVRWCRRETLACLERALVAAGFTVELLEPLADLDRRSDLERWLAERRPALPDRPLVTVLRRLLTLLKAALPVAPLATPAPLPLPLPPGRAPPRSPRPRRSRLS